MPDQFGRYQLIGLLGRGGMGEVYRAFDTVRQRTVALKLLPADLAHDEMFTARFRREALLAARLNEPHIIPIHDFGEIDNRLFLDMRLVEGIDLGKAIATHGALPPVVAMDIIAQVASALDSAHRNELVHRDVKPSNILLTGGLDQPFAYLVDFGIARSLAPGSTAITATSSTVGTFAYMAPERLMGGPDDYRSDIYALGCVLYETVTGRRVFDGELPALMYAHINLPPPPASAINARIGPAIDNVIAKAMAKNPADRYPSASELAQAARAALTPAPATSPAGAGVPFTYAPSPGATEKTITARTITAPSGYQPPSGGYPPPPRHTASVLRRYWIVLVAVIVVLAGAASIFPVDDHGSPKAAATSPPASASTAPSAKTSDHTVGSIAVCEQNHGLTQAAQTLHTGSIWTFKSCSYPAAAGADSDGFLAITAYTLTTSLPESSGASEYDFIVGPCTTFRLAYSFASQGTSQILTPFSVNQGEFVMEGSENAPLSLATADPAL